MAMLCCKVGEKVPDVTSPASRSPARTIAPCRAIALAIEPQAERAWRDFFRRSKRVPADEIALVELDRPADARRERVDRLGELVAVERHRGLEPQRIAGAEPARLDPVRLAGFQQGLPDVGAPPRRRR